MTVHCLTNRPSPLLEEGQRTFLFRDDVDLDHAVSQHKAYCDLLSTLGVQVRSLTILQDEPDSVFIEDTALVLDELAVLANMGTAARSREPAGVEAILREYREAVVRLDDGVTLEGGDVLRIGRTLLVGLSRRTNRCGIESLSQIVKPYGYRVESVPVSGCLHLKTGCTAVDERRLVVNPAWIDCRALSRFELFPVPREEPWGANILRIGNQCVMAVASPRTAELVQSLGPDVRTLDISEFAKVEGGVTCLSLLWEQPGEATSPKIA